MAASKLTAEDVSITKTIGGYWQCAAMVGGYRVCMNYGGFTKRHALRDFVRDVNGRPVRKENQSMSKQDPLLKSMKQTYRSSRQYQLDKLLEEESRWKRKITIATNKLAEVRRRMDAFTLEVVAENSKLARPSEASQPEKLEDWQDKAKQHEAV